MYAYCMPELCTEVQLIVPCAELTSMPEVWVTVAASRGAEPACTAWAVPTASATPARASAANHFLFMRLLLSGTEHRRDAVAQLGESGVEDIAGALGGGHVVAVTDDRGVGIEVVGDAEPGAGLHQRVEERDRSVLSDVDAFVFDADGVAVLIRRLGTDHQTALIDHLDAAVPALHHVAAATDRQLLARVAPAVGVHVQVLDPVREASRLIPGVIDRI